MTAGASIQGTGTVHMDYGVFFVCVYFLTLLTKLLSLSASGDQVKDGAEGQVICEGSNQPSSQVLQC